MDLGSSLSYSDKVTDGEIQISAVRDSQSPCLMAFGPHRGSVSFSKGSDLPKVALGKYALVINGEFYGDLIVDENNVSLDCMN